MTDLYGELGVERSADDKTIRKAYRRRAKRAHPDAKGGSAEAFHSLTRALTVLTDPDMRRAYDETGAIGEKAPDNRMAEAMQVIELHMSSIINQFASTWDERNDPRRFDVIDAIRGRICLEMDNIAVGNAANAKLLKFFDDMLSRLKRKREAAGPDLLRRGFERQIENAKASCRSNEKAREMRKLALELLTTYTFRWDAPGAWDKYDPRKHDTGDVFGILGGMPIYDPRGRT